MNVADFNANTIRTLSYPFRRLHHYGRQAASPAARFVSALSRVSRTGLARLRHRSDYARWSNAENLETWWETRTQSMAELIPKGTRVIEFGAGTCRLKSYLDATCTYIPSDIVSRGPDTVLCDLNDRPLPELHHFQVDVALFAGVLEYLGDLDGVADWLSQLVVSCVASYDCVPSGLTLPRQLRERFRRRYYGYFSDFTEEQLIALFHSRGFENVQTVSWTNQRIFLFTKDR